MHLFPDRKRCIGKDELPVCLNSLADLKFATRPKNFNPPKIEHKIFISQRIKEIIMTGVKTAKNLNNFKMKISRKIEGFKGKFNFIL